MLARQLCRSDVFAVGAKKLPILAQPGGLEGQLGALRRLCFGEVGFVEQLDALDDEDYTMCAQSPIRLLLGTPPAQYHLIRLLGPTPPQAPPQHPHKLMTWVSLARAA